MCASKQYAPNNENTIIMHTNMYKCTYLYIGKEEMVVGNLNAGRYNGDGHNGGENEDETDSDNDENELDNRQNEDQNELDEGNDERNVLNIGIPNVHINEGKLSMEIFNLCSVITFRMLSRVKRTVQTCGCSVRFRVI